MTRVHGRPNKGRKIKHMKNRNNVFTVTLVVLAFAIAPVTKAARNPEGGPDPISAATGPILTAASPVITVHSTDNVTRGKTGSFVLDMKPALMLGGMYVNFKVSGTAIAGVDYVLLVSPAYIGQSGYGVISLATLPDPRAQSFHQAYSVVVTLEPGLGYTLGEQKSALIWIKPAQ